MIKDLSWQTLVTGFLASLVGFASSFVIVLQGVSAVGANQAQANSALLALCLSMGLCAILLSLHYRMPIAVAWSTPGAALLITTAPLDGGFAYAVGAFLMCAVAIVASGFWKPLKWLVAAIPSSLANAMLAGILFNLCLAPVKAVAEFPVYGLAIVLAWLLAGRLHKLLAVPAALLAFLVCTFFFIEGTEGLKGVLTMDVLTKPVWVMPEFSIQALLGIALPLFVCTMASQNIPGVAVLRVNHYTPDAGPLFSVTGLFSAVSAFFGGHAVNLAAITAAMCAGEESHSDPKKRYWSAVFSGGFYILFGVFAAVLTAVVTLAPTILIQAVAGLALVSSCTNSILAAFEQTEQREAAAITFFVTASGLSFAGISGAFIGLLAGAVVLLLSAYHPNR